MKHQTVSVKEYFKHEFIILVRFLCNLVW